MIERPYGANDEMDRWANANGVRFAPKARCLHWVASGRCSRPLCDFSHRSYFDHVSGWLGGRFGRLLISQPYDLGLGDLDEMVEDCKKLGVKATITGTGWYGHGTVCIWFRSDGGPID